ncbi:hypothetical protein [Nocardiopsis ansamitocini]|uniref:DNA helicase n=1 Tax=Nocardiopsis ansamitocini TaxID=1670832 RepID=A0A9W6UHP0_9ACTN|nr:hypothetical protein [Nocardiopsis ansamitocini]GLU46563.1 hypothetical protein Nans01_09140 [Nocardiopsis ansamitocini]
MRSGERRALLVAVEGTNQATGGPDHARSRSRTLRSALVGADFGDVRTLLDPSRSRLVDELRIFFATAGPDDTLLLALSGRIVKNGEGSLHFFAAGSGRRPETAGVALDVLAEAIERGSARSVLLLLDCQYSGWFDDGPDGRAETVPELDLRRCLPIASCVVFAGSAGNGSSAGETDASFAQVVAAALGGTARDRDGDGWIDSDDLKERLLAEHAAGGRSPVFITEVPPVGLIRSVPGSLPVQQRPAAPLSAARGPEADFLAEVAVVTAGLLGECRDRGELRERLRVELRSVGCGTVLAEETVSVADHLLDDGGCTDPAGPRVFPGHGPDPQTEVTAFGAELAARALRLRRDHELDAAPASGWGRSTSGRGDREDPNAPFTNARWLSLLTYLRDGLDRTAVLKHLVDLAVPDGHAFRPAGRETLISGTGSAPEATPEELLVAHTAGVNRETLRYGYPLVVVRTENPDHRTAAPLFVVDAEVVDDNGVKRLRAVSPPEINPALLEADTAYTESELTGLRKWWHEQRDARGVPDLAATTRRVLAHLDIERADDILPSRLAAALAPDDTRSGAHNLAILFRVGSHLTGDAGLLADLDGSCGEGVDPGRLRGTALSALAGEQRPELDDPVLLLAAGGLSEAQTGVLVSAMNRRLTVVAAPPGTGAGQLALAAVHTAVAAGQAVLFAAPTAQAADDFVVRAGRTVEHLVVRTGEPGHLSRESAVLNTLLSRSAGGGVPTVQEMGLRDDWTGIRDARRAIDALARIERDLALLATARGRVVDAGWDPETLFRGGRPQDWLRRSERAAGWGLLRPLRRSVIRRGLGVSTDSRSLARLCEIARIERVWRATLDRYHRTTSLDDLYSDLEAVAGCHRLSSADYLSAVVGRRLTQGRQAVLNRLECLNWQSGNTAWSGFKRLLTAVPAWAVQTGRARGLPPQPGLFDLVVIDEADLSDVAAVVPLLYRAKRALVIGDPARPAPLPTLTEHEERTRRERAGLGERWLVERALGGPGSSAYRALARATAGAGGRVHWLDEHEGSHPLIAAAADRGCYGGRLTVLTDSRTLVAAGGQAVEWRDVPGECERTIGESYVNREEARRAVGVLQELDTLLPVDATLGVAAGSRAQCTLLRQLVGCSRFTREIHVAAASAFGSRVYDAVVVSPVLSGSCPDGGPLTPASAVVEQWTALLGTAASRIVVVGDRASWLWRGGVLADLAGIVADVQHERPPETLADLIQILQGMADEVVVGSFVHGHRVDLRVRTPDGTVLVLLDGSRDGRELRGLAKRQRRLRELSGLPVRRAPVWRCLHEPEALAKEIVLAENCTPGRSRS